MNKKIIELLHTEINKLKKDKASKVKYLSVWIFDTNKEVDNPMVQNDHVTQLRREMQEVRSLNIQIQALEALIRKDE